MVTECIYLNTKYVSLDYNSQCSKVLKNTKAQRTNHRDFHKSKEYVRWHHYVPEKLTLDFLEPKNSLIKNQVLGLFFTFRNFRFKNFKRI